MPFGVETSSDVVYDIISSPDQTFSSVANTVQLQLVMGELKINHPELDTPLIDVITRHFTVGDAASKNMILDAVEHSVSRSGLFPNQKNIIMAGFSSTYDSKRVMQLMQGMTFEDQLAIRLTRDPETWDFLLGGSDYCDRRVAVFGFALWAMRVLSNYRVIPSGREKK